MNVRSTLLVSCCLAVALAVAAPPVHAESSADQLPRYVTLEPGAYPQKDKLAFAEPRHGSVWGDYAREFATVAAIGVGGQVSAPETPTNAPPTPSTFLGSAVAYFTSVSSLQTFQTNDTFDVWAGAEYVNNLNTAATLGISWNLWQQKQADPLGFGIESQTRNAGVAGILLAQGFGVNFQKVYHDIKLEAFLEGERNFALKAFDAEVGARIFKALTDNTFAGFGISEFIGGGGTSKVPNMLVFAGVKM